MTVRRVRAVAVGVGLMLTLAACSSSHKTTTAATGTASGGSAGTGAPIVIGTMGSFSGPLASSQAGVKQSIEAWGKWVNSHGGVSGHPIKLIVKDDNNVPATSVQAVKQLVEQDHVVAIVSDQTNNDQAWASYIAAKGIPVIGGFSINTPFSTNPDFFVSGENFVALNYAILKLAKAAGPNYGELYCAEAPNCAQLKALQTALATAVGGVSVKVGTKVSATAVDYTAECQALKDAGVQSYNVGSAAAVVARVVTACKAQGLKATPIADDGTVTEAYKKSPALNGMVAAELTLPWFDTSVPAGKEYGEAIAKFAPNIGDANGPNAMYSWVAAKLFEKAVANVGSDPITSASLKQGLYKMQGETLGGLIGPVSFSPGKPGIINCGYTIGLTDGKFTEPNGLTLACAPDAVVAAVLKGLG